MLSAFLMVTIKPMSELYRVCRKIVDIQTGKTLLKRKRKGQEKKRRKGGRRMVDRQVRTVHTGTRYTVGERDGGSNGGEGREMVKMEMLVGWRRKKRLGMDQQKRRK
jgi:hypothetical protein